MSLPLCDLVDPAAVDAHLHAHLTDDITDEARADARALAEEALSFAEPPAGAHVLLARLAELDGDTLAFVDHTRRALALDPGFAPALADRQYLGMLQTGAGRRASAARRAELLFQKADWWSGRIPQLAAQFALAGRVLRVDDPRDHVASAAVASQWQFLAFLLFEGGLVRRFEADCGSLLPAAERAILSTWHDVRHRLVRLDEQRGRRGRMADLVTGERLDVTILHDEGLWPPGRIGLALLLPAEGRLALVGEPVLLPGEAEDEVREAITDADPLLIAELCLQSTFVAKIEQAKAEQDVRLRFALPDADPDQLDCSEGGVLEHLRRTRPALAARADAGDVEAESELLLDAIVTHRIITLRVPHTWELAQELLAEGRTRETVLDRVRMLTTFELLAGGSSAA